MESQPQIPTSPNPRLLQTWEFSGNSLGMSVDSKECRNPSGTGSTTKPQPHKPKNPNNKKTPKKPPKSLSSSSSGTQGEDGIPKGCRSGNFFLGNEGGAHRVVVEHELHRAELHQLPHAAVRAGRQGSSRIPQIPQNPQENNAGNGLEKWDWAWRIQKIENFFWFGSRISQIANLSLGRCPGKSQGLEFLNLWNSQENNSGNGLEEWNWAQSIP